MNRTTVLVVLLGLAGTAAGFLLYYGCIMELGVACPGSSFRPPGLILQGVGEAMLVIGLVVPRAMRAKTEARPKPAREVQRESESEPEAEFAEEDLAVPAPKPAVARAAAPLRPKAAANSGAQLFFCPECGRHYKTVAGRYCPVDATELKPMAR